MIKRDEKKLLLWLILLGLLTPLGLMSGAGGWGEWALEEIEDLFGMVPAGMRSLGGLWDAPLSDYSCPITGFGKGTGTGVLAYIISAFTGVALIILFSMVIEKFVSRKKGK